MTENFTQVQQQAEFAFYSSWDKLREVVGTEENVLNYLAAADGVNSAIEGMLDSLSTEEWKMDTVRDRRFVMRKGISDFVANSDIGREIPHGPDYYPSVFKIVDAVYEAWELRQHLHALNK